MRLTNTTPARCGCGGFMAATDHGEVHDWFRCRECGAEVCAAANTPDPGDCAALEVELSRLAAAMAVGSEWN